MRSIPFNIIISFTIFSINISLLSLITSIFFAHDYTKIAPQAFGVISQTILIYYFARGSETARRILGALSLLGLLFLIIIAFIVAPNELYLKIIGPIYLLICAYQTYCLLFSTELRSKLEHQRSIFDTGRTTNANPDNYGDKGRFRIANAEFWRSATTIILYSIAIIAFSITQLYFYRTDLLEFIGLSVSIMIAAIISCSIGYIINNRSFVRNWIPISIIAALIGLSVILTVNIRQIKENITFLNDEFTQEVAAQNNDWRFKRIASTLQEIDSEKCRGKDSFNAPDLYTACNELFNQHVASLIDLRGLSDKFYQDQSKILDLSVERLMKKYELPREYHLNFSKGVEARVESNRLNSIKLINGYINLDTEYADLFRFLTENKSNIEMKDGAITFKYDGNIELYNKHIKRIQESGESLSKISDDINAVRK